MNIFHTISH